MRFGRVEDGMRLKSESTRTVSGLGREYQRKTTGTGSDITRESFTPGYQPRQSATHLMHDLGEQV